MPSVTCRGTAVELNEEGFLVDPGVWDEELALALARQEEGLEALNEQHWSVIRFIRGHFLEHEAAPMVRQVCKGSGVPLKQIYDLFPGGPARGACKLAGLPKPDGCV
ncbi:TusE/DsrC/DsvC family sulfur relay protein [Geothrix sp. 21YS21S-2]|uniref:TusE/DsrC/DsvC family sulfur relay protein n=1 Tax=Geothrix sp. 21YS21S-2 TaxID=3068893 RepID=UPI0027BA19A1|nr:TusE/DsrC/DsvC family sulfur relay protein [Geothrix sp. 21YS21S-2]